MVSNCLNPACQVPFSYALDERFLPGSVDHLLTQFGDQTSTCRTEQYWLCGTMQPDTEGSR